MLVVGVVYPKAVALTPKYFKYSTAPESTLFVKVLVAWPKSGGVLSLKNVKKYMPKNFVKNRKKLTFVACKYIIYMSHKKKEVG